ncbi:AMP-binding protein [Sabulicella rubraurantiaca]|nr:AMP-binding protein [Sabulicella rubraurantiaca]
MTSYEAWRRDFRWDIPERFNIARACCDRWADGSGRVALLLPDGPGITFDELLRQSSRMANVLLAHGIGPADRVGVLLPQAVETVVAHMAIYRVGAIAVPLFQLFGADAIAYRLADCDARAVITDGDGLPKLPAGPLAFTIGAGAVDMLAAMERAGDRHECADTSAEDPALIIYTSGTTGSPKGALHAHRVLIGHLPGVEMPQDLFPQPGDLFWTPADWAWIGGLLDVLLPSLFHGVPVMAHRMTKFDPEEAFHLVARHGIRNLFLPPTALRLMRQVPDPARLGARPRSIGSGGETLGAEMLEWGREAFGVSINEFYGQTECNLVVSSCGALFPPKPGWAGRAVLGHEVSIVEGEIAIRAPDPVMFMRYWNRPEDTTAKFRDGWLMTGDAGEMDGDGFIRFLGRADDVITSAGYRIGPGEVEDCLIRHESVAAAAVIGIPDPMRTEAVAAAVVLRAGHSPSPELEAALQAHVRTRLAGHLYPRHIRFVAELPQTATGKIMRRTLRENWKRLP